MVVTNVLARPAMTMAPMSATPSDEPSCCEVYCSPPASLRPEASTDDCTTLPSCEASRPMPTPRRAIELVNAQPSSSGSIGGDHDQGRHRGASSSPARMMVRTAKRRTSRAPRAEVMNIVTETGSMRMPVSRASSPMTSCR